MEMMVRTAPSGAALLVVALLIVGTCAATSIQWTGASGTGLWSTPGNWLPAAVPTVHDDVTIGPGAAVVANGAAAVKSLVLGAASPSSTPATVTVYQKFVVGSGGAKIAASGVLVINGAACKGLSTFRAPSPWAPAQFSAFGGSARALWPTSQGGRCARAPSASPGPPT